MKSCWYQEVQPERDVSGTNFSNGQINFNWTMDSVGYFNPADSYVKIRFTVTNRLGVVPTVANQIAPTMFFCDSLFQQMKMNINNTCVSEIDDYCAQVAALKGRMYESEEKHNNYLADTNFTQAYFLERQAQIAFDDINIADGDPKIAPYNNLSTQRRKSTLEAIWHLPLGFWGVDEWIPGCQGLFNLQLTPQPSSILSVAGIESSNSSEGGISIQSMNLYLKKGLGSPVVSKKLMLEFRETRCQSQNLTTNSLHQKTFQVHPRTEELTLAFQFSGAGITSTLHPASKFKCNASDELKLRRFWLTYGGKQLPTPIPDTQFDTNIDYYVQRYAESILYASALYSPEPLHKWFERGPYYHFGGYSSEEKQDVRVYVSQQFDTFDDSSIRPNVLLFDHYQKKVAINIDGSQIKQVTTS